MVMRVLGTLLCAFLTYFLWSGAMAAHHPIGWVLFFLSAAVTANVALRGRLLL